MRDPISMTIEALARSLAAFHREGDWENYRLTLEALAEFGGVELGAGQESTPEADTGDGKRGPR